MNKYQEAYKLASNLKPRDMLDKKVRKAVDLVHEACDKAKKYDEINRVYLKNEVMESADINAERLQQLYEDMQTFIDKATPKISTKSRYGMGERYNDYYCESCGELLCLDTQMKKYSKVVKYCPSCGQKLDWSDKDDK